MMGHAHCLHIDGEFCSKCFPFKETGNIVKRIELIERQLSDVIDTITKIANYCYREK